MRSYSLTKNLCPICGKGTTRVKKIDYKLKDENGREFTVSDLEVEVCEFCGERIFNMEAVRKARKVLGATHKILVRLKPEMHTALATRARKSKRSITEEVYHLLEKSLREAK